MESLALVVFFEHAYASYAVAGAMVALFALAGAGLSPFVGPMVHRWGAARVVAVCATVQAVSFLGIVGAVAVDAPLQVVAGVVVVAGLFGPPVAACARAAWRTAAPTAAVREAGYTFDAISQELLYMGGPALVALFLVAGGPASALAATAALVIIGSGYFVASPLLRTPPPLTDDPDAASLRPSRRVFALMLASALTGLALGFVEVGIPALADEIGRPFVAGILVTAMSAGSLVGGILYGTRAWRISVTARHAISAFVLMIVTCALAGARSLPAAIVLAFLAGLPWSPLFASHYAGYAEASTSRQTVAVFTWHTTCVVIGLAAGAATSGLLVERHGPGLAFVASGATFAVIGLLVASLQRRQRRLGRSAAQQS